MAQTVINDSQGIVVREAGTGTRFENVVTNTGNVGVGASTGDGKVIGSLTLTSGGSGYTNGTYSQVALTGGSGTGATADIVVATNAVTAVVLRNPGQGYAVGDALSCASIGAGSGFIATVATTASIIRSDGTIIGSRIGAGTTTPVAGIQSAAGIVSSGFIDWATGQAFKSRIVAGTAITGTCTPPAAVGSRALDVNPLLDLSLQTGGTSHSGIRCGVEVSDAPSGLSPVNGVLGTVGAFNASAIGRTFQFFGVSGQTVVSDPVGAGNTFTLTGVQSANNFNATSVQTVATYTAFLGSALFSGAAHTITSFYGLRLQTPTLSGGATITNRWAISQEDTAANNVLAGRTAAGQAAGTAATALVDVGASTTARSSLRIRSGTAPTAPNDGDIWFDGSAMKVQIGGVTKTFTVT